MFIDLSVPVSSSMREQAFARVPLAAFWHLGARFNVLNTWFSLHFRKRPGMASRIPAGAYATSTGTTSIFPRFKTGCSSPCTTELPCRVDRVI